MQHSAQVGVHLVPQVSQIFEPGMQQCAGANLCPGIIMHELLQGQIGLAPIRTAATLQKGNQKFTVLLNMPFLILMLLVFHVLQLNRFRDSGLLHLPRSLSGI